MTQIWWIVIDETWLFLTRDVKDRKKAPFLLQNTSTNWSSKVQHVGYKKRFHIWLIRLEFFENYFLHYAVDAYCENKTQLPSIFLNNNSYCQTKKEAFSNNWCPRLNIDSETEHLFSCPVLVRNRSTLIHRLLTLIKFLFFCKYFKKLKVSPNPLLQCNILFWFAF